MVSLTDPPTLEPDASTTGELGKQAQKLARTVLDCFLSIRSVPNDKSRTGACGYSATESELPLGNSYLERDADVEAKLERYNRDAVIPGIPTLAENNLLCPFYLYKKEKYLDCLRLVDVQEIPDLKEHLWAYHRQPSYCPTCHDTFMLSEDWENHIRLRSCVFSGKPRPEGITALQMQLLAQSPNLDSPRDDQWLSIWKIVFPGVKAPIPFIPGKIETAVWALRDFWAAEGGQIMSKFLTEGLQQSPHHQNHRLNVTTLGSLVIQLATEHLVARIRQD
ncbi:hypothetical protein F5B22DRAFT_245504 [Xylaria bambusicola]|uniref:uncharacterized protein n=1 Tax=Xylaria bambusicola TaxID=326684 RepID=UPI002007E5B6|nr:uncharacterized protein F5B22DRAFT_245504 [Xylaria bambusicola]KAI0513233.1 hypothetical protein F5B22DRAFT_245504 [Xylaria bambusicola]